MCINLEAVLKLAQNVPIHSVQLDYSPQQGLSSGDDFTAISDMLNQNRYIKQHTPTLTSFIHVSLNTNQKGHLAS